MSRILDICAKFLLGFGLALAMFVPFSVAHAQSFKVLYNFQGSYNGPDGALPGGGLIADKEGNLYGTTESGGASGSGTVFETAPDGTEKVLYSFKFDGADGYDPLGALIQDKSGNLYGTTNGGGESENGTIFELSPSGTETVLYSFRGGSDGSGPRNLIAGTHGTRYGTTDYGGSYNGYQCEYSGCGTVYKLDSDHRETVLYAFQGESDGALPIGPLISDASGNLYGTTYGPGQSNSGCYSGIGPCGTVFKVAPDGTETVLYVFCSLQYCADGSNPAGGLIADSNGNLYGTTSSGGPNGDGTVFKLAPDGTETVLFSFNFGDGWGPQGSLVADKEGNLYGATDTGGSGRCYKSTGCGVIFEVTPGGTETVLHDFKQTAGAYPTGSLISINGYLYGTTRTGGSSINCGTNHKGVPYGCGTVFAVKK